MWVCVFVCARGRGGRDGKEAKKIYMQESKNNNL